MKIINTIVTQTLGQVLGISVWKVIKKKKLPFLLDNFPAFKTTKKTAQMLKATKFDSGKMGTYYYCFLFYKYLNNFLAHKNIY